ncbi:prepilin-type N-terminal cleavage/methylation domain-containing protein [Acinetobacter qingfengensis]|uniref:Uncharacterized protein n=1 Tax=Acinetobacter qingfengensis TaxID=1262585 RepID=A0A1E7QXJ3_9GAMM|nr:PilW family protein [Acinetobacter qingfengensis]KAA8731692.1 prepilin-type N-terminal cleavage/methylation domain-containing protein [Acinetobacter qingfengensis]OEY91792.1 hypothetical protein BJI46_06560 [Acinetobacter qingfengensis]
MKTQYKQYGFTLIELMVAIALGLIIVAAGIQLFITGQRSLNMQKGIADIQNNGVFGLNYMLRDIGLANLDAASTIITDTTTYGGIVLSTSNLPTTITSTIPLSQSSVNTSNVNVSASAQNSDQLVIQFYATQAGYNCEGEKYNSGQYIIQRYFLRKDDNGASTEPNSPLALACEAGSYSGSEATVISPTKFGEGKGQIILHRVDHFHVLLGVSNANHDGAFRYMNFAQYMALSSRSDTRINSIQLGMLVRSSESVGSENLISETQTFQVLDQSVTVKTTDSTAKYLRRVVQQTIALRNGLCITDSSSTTESCS